MPLDLNEFRKQFPILQRKLDGSPILYLDSAATALKPLSVLNAEQAYSWRYTANIHRGKHTLSEEASFAYEEARKCLARFIGGGPESLAFVRNTTEAINVVAHGLRLAKTDKVLIMTGDHHSNFVPWHHYGTAVCFDIDAIGSSDLASLAAQIELHRPRVLAVGHASNVTGAIRPVREICRLARSMGVITVVDGAQSVPHVRVDVHELGCDFLAFSGHKMMGPTGIGVLWGRPELLDTLDPLILGGGTVSQVSMDGFKLKRAPHKFEAGTPNISGAIGLAAAADFIERYGFDQLARHEQDLADALMEEAQLIPGVEIVKPPSGQPRLAIVSLVPDSDVISPDQIAVTLSDNHKIMTRSGFHCCQPLFSRLGAPYGSLRASAYFYNTIDEVRTFGAAMHKVMQRLNTSQYKVLR